MFLGHFGLALAVKRWGDASLGWLVLAAQWADVVWPVLVLAGIERVAVEPDITAMTPLEFVYYPWSHSLLMSGLWGILLGGGYYAWKRRPRAALIVGALVPSHWILDVFVHRPDLPLWPGGPTVGLGLWESVAGTLAIEFGLLIGGLGLYLAATTARDRIGTWGALGFAAVLALVYLGTTFGPTPADATAVAVGALGIWLLVLAAFWIDSHRTLQRRELPWL